MNWVLFVLTPVKDDPQNGDDDGSGPEAGAAAAHGHLEGAHLGCVVG